MTHMQERWEGVSLPGNYRLEKWLNGDDAGGYFETAVMEDGRRAVVKLVPESAAGSAGRLALWERARSLRHPNLLEVLDCGRAERDGEAVVFAVFEAADDTLAAAIGRSPLTEEEAGEVLTAVLGGLNCLRAQGLAHPALDADHVLGVGEQIKLSTDALREAPVGAPFHGELRTFWSRISPSTPARSEELLSQALGAEPEAAPRVSPGAAPSPVPAPAPVKVNPVQVAARPAAAAPPRQTVVGPAEAKPGRQVRFPGWVFGGAAAVVLVVLGLNLRRTPQEPARPAPVAAAATAPSTPEIVAPKASPFAEKGAKPATVPNTAPVTQTAPASTAPAADTPAPAPTTDAAPKVMWRVIAFTYVSRDAAAKKVEQLKQTHPGLEPSVFEPHHRRGFFLVALSGFMTRTDALRLQTKARAQGLPRDVYIHNFVE